MQKQKPHPLDRCSLYSKRNHLLKMKYDPLISHRGHYQNQMNILCICHPIIYIYISNYMLIFLL